MPIDHSIIQSFLDYLKFEKRYSPHTVTSYETDLRDFVDYIHIQYGQTALKDIGHGIIRSWLAGLKENGLTSKSLNRKISTLRSFFKYQLKTGRKCDWPELSGLPAAGPMLADG